jgi:hypothetical protein
MTVKLVAARGARDHGERLELSRDPTAHFGTLDILQRVEDPREPDPRIIGITIALEPTTEVAQRTENISLRSNQDGEARVGVFAQWPVSPYSPYVLSL